MPLNPNLPDAAHPGRLASMLFYKTDWVLSDFSTAGTYYVGNDGVVRTSGNEFLAPAIDCRMFPEVHLDLVFSAVTGTSPSLVFSIAAYADPTGPQIAAIDVGAGGVNNYATGLAGFGIWGREGTTPFVTNQFTYHIYRPKFVRLRLVTSGTWTALGASKYVALSGLSR